MENEERPSGFQKTIQSIALLLFLVVLPFGSYYYLSTGVDYRKTNLEELGDYGKIPAFNLRTQSGELLSSEYLKGKLVVINFTGLEDLNSENPAFKQVARLHDQFDDSGKVIFLSPVMDADSSDWATLKDYAQTLGIDEKKQWFLLTDNADALKAWASQFPSPDEGSLNPGFIAFADTSLVVRKFYNLSEEAQVAKMATHIALIIPQEKSREDIVFKREKEK